MYLESLEWCCYALFYIFWNFLPNPIYLYIIQPLVSASTPRKTGYWSKIQFTIFTNGWFNHVLTMSFTIDLSTLQTLPLLIPPSSRCVSVPATSLWSRRSRRKVQATWRGKDGRGPSGGCLFIGSDQCPSCGQAGKNDSERGNAIAVKLMPK